MTQESWQTWTLSELTAQVRAEAGFQAIDWHFALFCADSERDPACRSAVFVVAVIASRALREGHGCILIKDIERGPWANAWSERAEWTEATSALPSLLERAHSVTTIVDVVASSSAGDRVIDAPLVDYTTPIVSTPLVFDGDRRVYLTRYYLHELRLAKRLAGLVAPAARHDDPWLIGVEQRLDHYFPPQVDSDAPDLQREAARNALLSRLLVVSGGPGTGKTATVVKILALLVEQAAAAGGQRPRILLLAPTGKAAARLNESIVSALARLELSQAVRAAIEPQAMTIHRALGVRADSATRFVRDANYPLVADIVVVDEGSMVDLAVMRHLCEALSPSARLLILGDRHQLASVEAGSVFSDLCDALLGAQGARLGVGTALVSELTKSYRFKTDSGIAALAECVRRGAWQEFLHTRANHRSDLAFFDAVDERAALRVLLDATERLWMGAFSANTPAQALEHFARFRVLCAHREGVFGVQAINQSIAHHLFERGHLTSPASLSRGHLMMVLENDVALGVNNGDVFIVWPDDEGRLWAWFPVAERQVRRVSLPQLPRHEMCFAMTIHKSQGSEYDAVALVLPAVGSPIMTRELLYTGITRSKERVYVFAADSALQEALEKRVVRRSGLGAMLRRLRVPAPE